MGDSKRHSVFCQFIKKQFPKAFRVLVVADGKGILARCLANQGFEVVVMEKKPRFEGRKHKRIEYKKGWFDSDYKANEDLIVGMHPDEATAPIIKSAVKSKKPFAVVPCCVVGEESNGVSGYEGWLKKLMRLDRRIMRGMLKMHGKNQVLFKR